MPGKTPEEPFDDLPLDDDTEEDKRVRLALGLGKGKDWPGVDDRTQERYRAYLADHLDLPCEVTGIEDFRWEEPYVFGAWDEKEYEKLKKTQPSYSDRYRLLGIAYGAGSDWMLCAGEDLVAHVQRVSDGKKFELGLSELKVTNAASENHQLLDDYAYFFWNFR